MADDATLKTLTLVAPEGVALGSTITISDPLPDGTVYKVKADGTVPDVTSDHFTTTLKDMGFKRQPAAATASATPPTQSAPSTDTAKG